MKKLILLSLLSILATGCFSENAETNPFIQSEAEKQISAAYRLLVNENGQKIDELNQKIDQQIDDSNNDTDDLNNKITGLQGDLRGITFKSTHTLNFPSGVCSDRYVKQINFSSKVRLDTFLISIGGLSEETNFGLAVPRDSRNQDWKVHVKVFRGNVPIRVANPELSMSDIKDQGAIKLNINKIDTNPSHILTVVVEYGINETFPNSDYNDEGLTTLDERLGGGLYNHCVKDVENNTIIPHRTNQNVIISFVEEIK